MESLYSRLKPSVKEVVDTQNNSIPITQRMAIVALKEKTNWLDLTLLDCSNIIAITDDAMHTTVSQISTLFN